MKFRASQAEDTRDKMIANLKSVIHDAEEMIKATSEDMFGDQYRVAKEKFNDTVEELREQASHAQDRIKDAADETAKQVKAHPLESIGIALGVGLLIGIIFKSSR
jgi:ElaB/YqjD/DUF883 family membrane-anchored ribosome-binding protein